MANSPGAPGEDFYRGDDDDDDDDEEDSDNSGADASDEENDDHGAPRGSDEEDEDEEEEEEEKKEENHTPRRASFTAETIREEHFVTYGKKVFGVEESAFVVLGSPLECADGEIMGHIIASKSPEEWKDVKSKHIYVLNTDGNDYMYVAMYVEDSPTAEIDKKRLHPIHRPVCKGLVERFNQSNIKPERRAELERVMNFVCPPESAGPQINPHFQRVFFPSYTMEAASVPTAMVKRLSKPRQLKGRRTAAAAAAAEVPKPPPSKSARKRPMEEAASPHDGSSTSTAANVTDSVNGVREHSVEGTPFKRLRSIDLQDVAKTHSYVEGGKLWVVEH